MYRTRFILKGLLAAVLVFAATGCGALEAINPFDSEDDSEVTGIVESVDAQNNLLTVAGIEYTVTVDTEYEGFEGLSDISPGDEVEIEYEEREGDRVALEIEEGGSDDD